MALHPPHTEGASTFPCLTSQGEAARTPMVTNLLKSLVLDSHLPGCPLRPPFLPQEPLPLILWPRNGVRRPPASLGWNPQELPVSPSPCVLPRLSLSVTQATPRPRLGSCLISHPLPLPLYLNKPEWERLEEQERRKTEAFYSIIFLFFQAPRLPWWSGGRGQPPALGGGT